MRPCQGRRTEELLYVDKRESRSDFALSLVMDPDGDTGISFWENYEYDAMGGIEGREYGYGVQAPYDALATLVSGMEERSGRAPEAGESLEDRLAASLRALVSLRELGDHLPIRENCARVTAWFEAAGVPTEPRDWVWISSPPGDD